MSTYADITTPCIDCHLAFSYSATDQRQADELGYGAPERCPSCRGVLETSRRPSSPAAQLISDAHAHHWLIGVQAGPSSEGTCKTCGETRDFQNAFVRTYRTTVILGGRRRA
jgi:hypothetical protein